MKKTLLTLALALLPFLGNAQIITTVAGGGSGAIADGLVATAIPITEAYATAIDASGNIYISDTANKLIRKVTAATGLISTVAGNGIFGYSGDNGAATAAKLSQPRGIAVDAAGNIYIADTYNHSIRKVTAATGIITSIVGLGVYSNGSYSNGGYWGDNGPATLAGLNEPSGVAVDAAGNIYIADSKNHRIRKVTAATGIITTVAGNGIADYTGDGVAISASLKRPLGVTVDAAGNIYFADSENNMIRKVNAATGIITRVAGTGNAGSAGDSGVAKYALLNNPSGVVVDTAGNMYIADFNNFKIRKVTVSTGIISTVVGNGINGFSGNGGAATAASISHLFGGLAIDTAGNIYIADTYNHSIRKVTTATGIITSIVGNGTYNYAGDNGAATAASLANPLGVVLDADGNIYIADTYNHSIRKVTTATGIITTIAGNGTAGISGDNGAATEATLYSPYGIALDADGNIYIADTENNKIRKVNAATGIITTVAGNGTGGYSGDNGAATAATLYRPSGVALDAAGNIYITDSVNNRIRKVTAATGIISTVAGNGIAGFSGDNGTALSAKFYYPIGIAMDIEGNIYFADYGNHRIRKVTVATGIITTVAGNGGYNSSLNDNDAATSASLYYPSGVAIDATGNIYIADKNHFRIRKVTVNTGIITTVAGAGFGVDGSYAMTASLNYPSGVALDAAGNIYIADTNNLRIRKITQGVIPAPSASAQTLNPGSTVANLVATGTNLQWYSAATGGTVLATSTVLTTGTYYVSQTIDGIESFRTAVLVTIIYTYYTDADGDSYGNPLYTQTSNSISLAGYVLNSLDCNDANANVHPGALEICGNGIDDDCNGLIDETCFSEIRSDFWNTTLATLNTPIYAVTNNQAQAYRFEVTNGANSSTYETTNNYFDFTTIAGITYATTYTIRVALKINGTWGTYRTPHNVTTPVVSASVIPITSLSVGSCGVTLAALNTPISATSVYGATGYRFEIIKGSITTVYNTSTNSFTLSQALASVTPGVTYTIRAAALLGGIYGNYGAYCTVTTPMPIINSAIPTVKLLSAFCGVTLSAIDTKIGAEIVSGATGYLFEITTGGVTTVYNSPEYNFKLSQSGVVVDYGFTYTIRVAALVGGFYGNYGASCSVTTPALNATIIPTTTLLTNFCGSTLATLDTKIGANPVYLATGYRFEIITSGVTTVYNSIAYNFMLSQALGTVPTNTTYTIRVAALVRGVYGNYGASCTVTTPAPVSYSIPTITILPSFCGATLAALDAKIGAILVSVATGYRFEITTGGTTTIYNTTTYNFMLSQAGVVVDWGKTYSIRVAALVNGVYGTYGASCNVSTPVLSSNTVPLTKVGTAFCNTTLVALDTKIGADVVAGATGYRFEIIKGGITTVYNSLAYNFRLSQTGVVVAYGTTYTIRASALVGGFYGNYGTSCNVTTPPAPARLKAKTFEVSAYPNPFETAFSLNLETSSKEDVTIAVYDMMGKLVESHQLNSTEVANLQIGNNFAAGIYNVIVSQANEMQAIRLIRK